MPTPRKPITSIRICWAISFSLLDVDEAEAVGDLAADEEVAPQRLFLGQRLVLIDRLDRQVVRAAHREVGEIDLLVADEQPAGGGRDHAGHHLDQRRFAGAVVADQADDLVAPDAEIDVLERLHRAEVFLHVLQADDRGEILSLFLGGFIHCNIHCDMLLAAPRPAAGAGRPMPSMASFSAPSSRAAAARRAASASPRLIASRMAL